MRSADMSFKARHPGAMWAAALTGLLCALLCGCAGVSAPGPTALPPSAAAPKAGVSAPANEAGVRRPQETPSGISPAVQRAFDRAVDALNAGHADDAARDFLELSHTYADLGGPHANLGIIYRQSGKTAEAVAELEQAVALDPQQPVYLNQLGIAYRQQGEFAKARAAYEKAIALDPGYPVPYLNLGILFDLYLWDSKRALELYDRYLALTPDGDAKVVKWVADIKNRNQQGGKLSRQEQP